MTRRRAVAAALVALAATARAPEARGNGAFPASGQIVVDPADPARIGVRTTYGLVATADGGASWRWTCEPALGYEGGDHPQLAIADDGTVFGGLADGVLRGALGACAWSRGDGLAGRRVVDVAIGADGLAVAAVEPASSGERAEVWASSDRGATWSRLGTPLPAKLAPLTLDRASSGRIVVSGLLETTPARGALAWSDDEGATWGMAPILDADASKAPYIGAVDPLDPDVIWVRLDAAPGQLVVTRDGGATWETALVLEGFLRAFALSPDGSEVLAGGEVDGLWRSPADAPAFVPAIPIAARCAQWRDDAIDVCGTESLDGFTAARSVDGGATFAPLLVQACLAGPEACDAGTEVRACAAAWPALATQIGVDPLGCGAHGGGGAGPGTGGGTGGDGGSGGRGAGTTASSASAATGADSTAGGAARDAADVAGGGCGCRSTPTAPFGSMAAACATMALLAAARRRHRAAAPPTRGGAR